jgi:hypothetical protein
MRTVALLGLLLASCAAPRVRAPDALPIPATHYQSMTGVTFQDGEESASCKRDLITGSHIPRWFCRFGDDPAQYQLSREMLLVIR